MCVRLSFQKPSGSKLFDSSDDEDGDDEEEDSRFQIKPQFEGRAGQKVTLIASYTTYAIKYQMLLSRVT